MKASAARNARNGIPLAAGLLLLCCADAWATDWPQYRGPTTDGISPDPIATTWATNSPGFVVWRNTSLTNGFSSFAVSQGRAFTLISMTIGEQLMEVCVAVDAATGTNIWASPVGVAPGDPPDSVGNGGDGTSPYNTGDGPRSTPTVAATNVIVLSGHMVLASLNVANGSTNWMKDLKTLYGASEVGSGWNNAASPRLDNDLIFVNLNTSTNNLTLYAFRTTDGSWAWRSQNERLTHTTPVVATILGTQQVLFATVTGIVSLDRHTGARLWKYTYPWGSISTSMGASPVVYSNIVFCTAAYNKGSAAVRIDFTNGTWGANQLWTQTYPDTTYQSIWMTPVAYQGYLYGQFAYFNYLTCPLNCLELASGKLMWSTPNFGKGATILVNRYLLSLTEDGQLVLVNPDPSAYVELARFQTFQFSETNHGKCWNSPAYSNGRIYARSTRGGICLDVSVPGRSPLKLLLRRLLNSTQLQLLVSTVDGSPIDSERLAAIKIHSAASLPASAWSRLTNSLILNNGWIEVNLEPSAPQLYLIAVEHQGSSAGLVQSLQRLPGGLRLHVGSADGYPIAESRLAGIDILFTTNLLTTVAGWSSLTNNLTLTNGVIEVILEPSGHQRYFIATEQP